VILEALIPGSSVSHPRVNQTIFPTKKRNSRRHRHHDQRLTDRADEHDSPTAAYPHTWLDRAVIVASRWTGSTRIDQDGR
jgi:hypothetical protein